MGDDVLAPAPVQRPNRPQRRQQRQQRLLQRNPPPRQLHKKHRQHNRLLLVPRCLNNNNPRPQKKKEGSETRQLVSFEIFSNTIDTILNKYNNQNELDYRYLKFCENNKALPIKGKYI